MLKPEFIASLKEIEGLDVEALVESLGVRPETSIRINRRKLDDPAVLGYDGLQPVSWCGSGFYLPDRPVFTLNPLFHAGLFYAGGLVDDSRDDCRARLSDVAALAESP